MKNIVFIAVLAFPLFVYCQTGLKSKFAIAMVNSLDASFRFTTANSNMSWLKEELDSTETWKTAFSSGLQTSLNLSSNWTLVGGVNYAEKGQQLKSNALLDMNFYRTSYRMIELPIFLRYSRDLKVGTIQFGLGPDFLFLLNNISRFQLINSNSPQTIFVNESTAKKFMMGSILQVAYQRNLYKNTDIQFAVNYKQQLSSFSDGDIQRMPFSIGLQLGFIYHP